MSEEITAHRHRPESKENLPERDRCFWLDWADLPSPQRDYRMMDGKRVSQKRRITRPRKSMTLAEAAAQAPSRNLR